MIKINKTLKFNVGEYSFAKILDNSTSVIKLTVCSSGMNAHKLPFSKETLKTAAETSLRGKPILAEYEYGDLGTHKPPDESNAVGYIIENQDFEYRENDDGTTSLICYAVLWNFYARKEYEVIADSDNFTKGVSMEIRINDSEYGWEGNPEIEEIKNFQFLAVCVLGDEYTPASPGSQAKMVKFSEKVKEIEDKFFSFASVDDFSIQSRIEKLEEKVFATTIQIDNSKDSSVNGDWRNPGSNLTDRLLNSVNANSLVDEAFLLVEDGWKTSPSEHLKYPHHVIRNGKLVVHQRGVQAAFQRASQQGIVSGEVKAHLLKHYKELELDVSNFTEMEERVKMEDDKVMENKLDCEDDMNDTETKNKDEETEKVSMENKEDIVDYAKAYVDLQLEFTKYKSEVATDLKELESLRTESYERKKAETQLEIEKTFAKIEGKIPLEKIEELRKEAQQVDFANKDAFCNKIKASVVDYIVEDKETKEMKFMAIDSQGCKQEEDFLDWYKG